MKFVIKLLIILSIFQLESINLYADNSIKSIFLEYDTIKSDTSRIDALCLRAWQTRKTDYQLSSAILDSIEYLLDYSSIKYDFIRPNIYLIRANSLGFLGNEKEMLDLYEKAIMMYSEFSNSENEKIRNEAIRKKSVCFNNLAKTYLNNNEIKLAIEMYYKSLQEVYKLNDKQQLSIRYSNIGFAYLEYTTLNGYIDSAELYLKKSYDLEKELNDLEGLYWANHGMGQLEFTKHNYLNALEYFKLTLDIAIILEYEDFQMEAYQFIGSCYDNLDNIHEANNYYLRALKIAEKLDAKSTLDVIYATVANLYARMDNYKMAYIYQGKLIILKDTLEQFKSVDELAKFHALFDNEKQKQQIELLKKDKELIDKQKMFYLLVIIAACLIIILVLNQVRLKNKSNKKLFEKNAIIREKNKEIVDSIDYASKIQSSILPSKNLFEKEFKDSFRLYYPHSIVSGDFYYLVSNDEQIFLAVCDCTGHGVPGAFMSMIGYEMLNEIIINQRIYEPSRILARLNSRIYNALKQDKSESNDGMDLALCVFNKRNNEVKISCAGNSVFVYNKIRDNGYLEIKKDRFGVGSKYNQNVTYTEHTLHLIEGDFIYMLTDGYTDQMGGEKNKKFMIKRLKDLFENYSDKSCIDQLELFENNFKSWKGNYQQVDDVTLIGIMPHINSKPNDLKLKENERLIIEELLDYLISVDLMTEMSTAILKVEKAIVDIKFLEKYKLELLNSISSLDIEGLTLVINDIKREI